MLMCADPIRTVELAVGSWIGATVAGIRALDIVLTKAEAVLQGGLFQGSQILDALPTYFQLSRISEARLGRRG